MLQPHGDVARLMIHSIGWETDPSRFHRDRNTMMEVPTEPERRGTTADKNTVGSRDMLAVRDFGHIEKRIGTAPERWLCLLN